MNKRSGTLGFSLLWIVIWVLGIATFLTPRQRLTVEIEVRSRDAGNLQLFVDDGRGFREELSRRTAFPGRSKTTLRVLEIELDRPPLALRLDPLDSPGLIEISRTRVSSGGTSRNLKGEDLDLWHLGAQIESLPGSSSTGLRLRAVGNDPQMTLDGTSIGWPRGRRSRLPKASELLLGIAGLSLLILASKPAGQQSSFDGPLAVAAPLSALLAVHSSALSGWWIRDDPCLLVSIATHGIGPHFWDPAVWRTLSGNVLMPWQLLSLGFDASLFGLDPGPFYFHQLLAFAGLLWVTNLLLRRHLDPFARSLALTLFTLSAPSFAITHQLMNRHYLEGTALALLAVALYDESLDRESIGWSVAGAMAFLLATTAKEVFVPLVVILPLVPRGEVRRRLRHLVPFCFVAAMYILWRVFMLGGSNILSGYAESGEEASLFDPLARISSRLGLQETWMLAALLAGLIVAYFARSPWRLWGGVTSAVLVAPLLPVAGELAPRHFFLPILLVSVAAATALVGWLGQHRRIRAILTLILLLWSLRALTQSAIWREYPTTLAHYRAEGQFLLHGSGPGILQTSLEDSGFDRCMTALREPSGTEGPGFCGDPCWCGGEFPSLERWVRAGDRIVPSNARASVDCAVEAPLTVSLQYLPDQSRISWDFGPWTASEGKFELLLVTSTEPPRIAVPVPIASRGSTPYFLDRPFHWVVKFRSAEGWQTYSPVLTLDPAKETAVLYERPDL